MRLDALLAGAAVAVLLATIAVVALVPGLLAAPDDEPPARLNVAETTLDAGEVTGETATLTVTAYVAHRGGAAENVTLVVRATDADSGLLADATERDLGELDGDREHEIAASVTVPREGGYEIEALLYVDGNRVDGARADVRGVGALTPPHAQSSVAFHEFPFAPSVEYSIVAADGETATLEATSYLTNGGDDPESDLEVVVTARQADSNVVADRDRVAVGGIEPGRTETVDARLEVPDGYDYYLDATLWRDGVVVAESRTAANLNPEETIAVNETRREIGFEAGDFETDRPASESARETPVPEAESQHGLGVALGVVAVLCSLLAARRWSA